MLMASTSAAMNYSTVLELDKALQIHLQNYQMMTNRWQKPPDVYSVRREEIKRNIYVTHRWRHARRTAN